MIEGRVVRLGNSAAIAISKKDLKENELEFNQAVRISVINLQKSRALDKMFGLMKGAKPFKREKSSRSF